MILFYAVTFSDDVKENIFKAQTALRAKSLKGRFTDKDNFHITMKYMGDVPAKEVDTFKDVLEKTAYHFRKFNIEISGIDGFNQKNGKLFYANVKNNSVLLKLYNVLENNLLAEGYPKEKRRFNPHCTIARETELDKNADISSIILNCVQPVKGLTLIESERINGRVSYKNIKFYEFK